MKTTPVMTADLGASVFAVPPLARNKDLSLNRAANAAQIRHIEAGGVTTLLYGGNANFFHLRVSEYPALLDMLEELAAPGTWVVPSVGPEYGLLMDQVAILKQRRFPTAMVLPLASPGNSDGLETGVAQGADAYGRQLILYIKSETGLTPEALGRLVKRGAVCAVKYGIERPNPAQDDFLKRILDNVDRNLVVSGMGERPAIIHLRDFGLAGFTSGCVCIAPRGSRLMLKAAQRKDWAEAERLRAIFMPLEECRIRLHLIRVLHEALTLSGIADMGPILPMLSNIDAKHHAEIRELALALKAADERVEEKLRAAS
jgi:dihydrodipicolinate synthase/N-acetylneuraminate lyase